MRGTPRTPSSLPATGAVLALALGFVACERAATEEEQQPAAAAEASLPANPAMLYEATGFSRPESMLYDPAQDIYFVANINGESSAADNNGFISRVRPDGTVEALRFIEGGRDSVVLNAPKGMAVIGSTLWVADIDRLRAFDRETGRPAGGIDLAAVGVEFLNDLEVGGDGSLYVSDTGSNRVLRIERNLRVSPILEGDTVLRGPNGLLWDPATARLLIASFRGDGIYAWTPGDTVASLVATGPGGFDGLARFPDGSILVSSLPNDIVFRLEGNRLVPVIPQIASPADIGADPQRGRLLVPMLRADRVQVWGEANTPGG